MEVNVGVMTVATTPRPLPTPLPAEWTFWADRFDPAVPAGEPPRFIPIGPVRAYRFLCNWRLSNFGRGEVGLIIADSLMTREQMAELWSWRLWAYYDGQPVWCGIPDGITDDGGPGVELTLTELPRYLERRQFDTEEPVRYDQVEQTIIARDLAAPVADVGVEVLASHEGDGVPRDRTYARFDSESRAQLLINLANVIDGCQFRSRYYADGTTALPRAQLLIAHPRVGIDGDLGLTVPGSAVSYSAKWDSDMMRTRTFAVGEAPAKEEGQEEEPPKLYSMVDRPQPGVPRLDYVDDYPGVTDVASLAERAGSMAATYARPVLDITVSAGEVVPPLGSYGPGDSASALIVSPFMPDGMEVRGQLIEVYVNAADARVDWTISVLVPPGEPRRTLIGQLAALHRLTTGIFRSSFR